MSRSQFVKFLAVGFASTSLLLPASRQLHAASNNIQRKDKSTETKTEKTKHKKKSPRVLDVELAEGSILKGEVVDQNGVGVENTAVVIRRGKIRIAQTTTDRRGRFVVKDLRGGFYHLTAGQAEGLFRLWAPKTAHPSARRQVVLVSNTTVVRGQDILSSGLGTVNVLTLGLGATGAVLGGVALEKTNSRSYKGEVVSGE